MRVWSFGPVYPGTYLFLTYHRGQPLQVLDPDRPTSTYPQTALQWNDFEIRGFYSKYTCASLCAMLYVICFPLRPTQFVPVYPLLSDRPKFGGRSYCSVQKTVTNLTVVENSKQPTPQDRRRRLCCSASSAFFFGKEPARPPPPLGPSRQTPREKSQQH